MVPAKVARPPYAAALPSDVEDAPIEAALRSHVARLVAERDDPRGHDLPAPVDGGERVGRRAAGEAQIDQARPVMSLCCALDFEQRGEIEVAQVDGPVDPPLGHRQVRHHVAVHLPRRRPRVEREPQTAQRAFRSDLERRLQRVSAQRGHQPRNLRSASLSELTLRSSVGVCWYDSHAAVDRQGALGGADRQLVEEDRILLRRDRAGQVGEAEPAIRRQEREVPDPHRVVHRVVLEPEASHSDARCVTGCPRRTCPRAPSTTNVRR